MSKLIRVSETTIRTIRDHARSQGEEVLPSLMDELLEYREAEEESMHVTISPYCVAQLKDHPEVQ